MLVIELISGASVPLPGARYLRREGDTLVVTNAEGEPLRSFVRAEVKGFQIAPDDFDAANGRPGPKRTSVA